MSEHLHVVCFDAPSPPDYGGAIDLYCKITALHAIGKKIILHYYCYKENRNAAGLEAYCEEINYYKRNKFKSVIPSKPYIVSSRVNKNLIKRLNRDSYSVLLEGIHCTGLIPYLRPDKKIVVRVHNDERRYYKTLFKTERSIFKKLYFLCESRLLAQYQKKLSKGANYVFLSRMDEKYFDEAYELPHHTFIPCFIPWQNIKSKTGKGTFCLYHGNLEIAENLEAAKWLVKNVFSKTNIPLIIAGKNANALKDSSWDKRVKLISSPSDFELTELIKNAQINVLPSLNLTGVKLKLLHALIEGRFCITNNKAIRGSGVREFAAIAETPSEWIQAVNEKWLKEFTKEMAEERKNILTIYDNLQNAKKLSALL